MRKRSLLILLLASSLLFRFGLFFTKWDDLRHGSSLDYGSAAIGLTYDNGLTVQNSERMSIHRLNNNISGNYLDFHKAESREEFTEFLPGPAFLLAALWKIIPYKNFAPYIIFQILIDSILIMLFYVLFEKADKIVFLSTACIMIFNLPVIKRTLMMGYDFWPQFAVLTSFIGLYYALKTNKAGVFLAIGFLSGLTIWFRSITSFLPFTLVIMIACYQKYKERRSYRTVIKNSILYILPVILMISSLSIFRYHQTGSPRPTRSTFWHSFFSGVAQFQNPYNINSNDEEVWNLGKRLNPELEDRSLSDMYKTPDSPYEQTLRHEASRLLKEHPFLLIRNVFYRMGIMISPFLYKSGDFIPPSLYKYFIPVGIIALILWFLGISYVYRMHNLLFWITVSIYAYFLFTFGWFYIVGRVILPFIFINIFIYLFGLRYVFEKIYRR